MRTRYAAAIFPGGSAQAEPARTGIEAALPASFSLVFGAGGVLLFSDRPESCLRLPGAAIVGEIFARGEAKPCRSLGPDTSIAIERSCGETLVEAYWGAYVAVVINSSGATTLVRAPFGDLGCYYLRSGAALLVASDLPLLCAIANVERRLDVPALARHIAYPEWRSHETCLSEVSELRGGDSLRITPDGITPRAIWSPWRFVAEELQIDDPHDAARRVCDAIQLSVRARTRNRTCLLLLSGGLDSAIVAAVLAEANADFSGLNLIANDAASDEWRYASLAAQSLGIDLECRRFALDKIDVRRSGAAEMPYPVHRCFTQALDDIAIEVAEARGAELIVDGGGGDNVFFGLRSVSILADCLLTSGFDQRFWIAARALGDLAQTGTATLLRRTIARAWFRSRPPHLAPNLAFLSADAKAAALARERHPWFAPPPGVLPGRASHIALLAPAQNLVEALQAQARYPSMSPLVSQPVVETCLRVPSWSWIAPGRNRAAARRAFETSLPPAIIDRRSKGAPTGFVAAIFEQNRSVIRNMLLGGALAEAGLLDRRAVADALDHSGPTRDFGFVRIMELVDAEAWARAQD
ncbi:asparagine synthase-related protein [Sphingomonas cannabina]|uniref:asparagine synthase-related protein n=1 Tax=Sphingomonas cannabina TaxID=2899123 RepID=UPI001F2993B9|nr:asparagine synthase-related protein [Sphingomonas cannabina]UIJ46344.1 asparagine synthase-related protein [Sphingomonas cannabina]